MTERLISYAPHSEAAPESESNALAAVYRFVLAKKKAAPESRPDEKGSQHDLATHKYT